MKITGVLKTTLKVYIMSTATHNNIYSCIYNENFWCLKNNVESIYKLFQLLRIIILWMF